MSSFLDITKRSAINATQEFYAPLSRNQMTGEEKQKRVSRRLWYLKLAERKLENQAKALEDAGYRVEMMDTHKFELAVGILATKIEREVEGEI